MIVKNKAIIVALFQQQSSKDRINDEINELISLSETLNYSIENSYIVNGVHTFKLRIPPEWNVGEEDEVVSQPDIDNGVKFYDINVTNNWAVSYNARFDLLNSELLSLLAEKVRV